MRKIHLAAVIASLPVALSAVLLMGCGSGGTGQETVGDGVVNEDVAPSLDVTVIEAVLSSALDEEGLPVNGTSIFTPDTPEIFFTFWLSTDLCCTHLLARWLHLDEIIYTWVEEGPNLPYPYTVSISSPENGFTKGNYRVVIYIGIVEVISVPFTVE